MFDLYPFQNKILQSLREKAAEHNKLLLQLPTGAGKTVIMGKMIQECIKKNKKCIFVVHRVELANQSKKIFESFNLQPVMLSNFSKFQKRAVKINYNLVIAMAQTLVNCKFHLENYDLIIFDEAHHCPAKTWKKIITKTSEKTYTIGMTATPIRSDNKGLKTIYDILLSPYSIKELIKETVLCDYDIVSLDVEVEKFFEETEEKNQIFGDIRYHFLKYCKNKQTIIFCPNLFFSKKLAEMLQEEGIKIKHIDCNSDPEERKKIIEEYRKNKIQVLTNMDLISEGFDVPQTSCVMMLRNTDSLALYLQQIGRCLRKKNDGGKAIIIDMVGNVFKHGLPCGKREWSLKYGVRGENSNAAKEFKKCAKCQVLLISGMICKVCGYDNSILYAGNEIVERKEVKLKLIEKENFIESREKYFQEHLPVEEFRMSFAAGRN